MFTAARLNAGLLVCEKDVVLGPQGSALPNAFVKIQDRTRQSSQRESLPSLADDLARCIQAGRDDIIGPAFIGEKNDLSADRVYDLRREVLTHS